MRRASAVLATVSLLLGALDAGAQDVKAPTDPCAADAPPPPAAKGIVTVAPVCIKGRPQKPNVAVDVARIVPRSSLPELRKPFVDRIARAAERDPF